VSFQYHAPASIDEAVALAARFGDDARFLAGGTDLIVQWRRGRIAPRHVVSLARVAGLDGVSVNGEIALGARVTHRRIEREPAFGGALRALPEAAAVVGGHQTRNVGTVGGNIANASPAADVVPVLLALDAAVTLRSTAGERTLALDDFLAGPGETRRRPDELLTLVRAPALAPGSATAFLKAGRRRAMEISLVCVVARITLDPERRRCVAARVALGAVGPRAMRAREAERALLDRPLDDEAVEAAARAAAAECRPIGDVRASERYRRHLTRALVARAIRRCAARIGEGDARR
jgi:carbon-monoxide dehydrogenase medium subunit